MGLVSTITSDITFGLGLLSSFGAKVDIFGIYANGSAGASDPSASSSVVNSILGLTNTTPSFGQLFSSARPVKGTIRPTSKIMKHPVESGVTLSDHKIINPVEIDIPLIVGSSTYSAIYSQIRAAYLNSTLLSVKTRVGVFSNMIIKNMPHEEEAEMFDAIALLLQLEEVQFFLPNATTQADNFQPADPLLANTISSGLQAPIALSTSLLTTALSAASYASLAGKGFL